MKPGQYPWSTEETFKFLNLYRNESVIWDINKMEHKDKSRIKEAWDRIVKEMNIPLEELKRKKEGLMATFRQHYRKKQKIGYKPIWMYYDVMEEFLETIYEPKITYYEEEKDSDPLSGFPEKLADDNDEDDEGEIYLLEEKTPKKRRMSPNHELQQATSQMSYAFNVLNETLQAKASSIVKECKDDESDLYGKLIAKKLKQFPDSERQEIMYEIDGLLLKRLRERRNFESYIGTQ
ncbi:unnamed protein product [Leptidea sinapis]|uniref:MADF domain-containing protein n=1 Tax=Leptidea sinapis TaxID=189913 RepID=A0A5E4PXN0_9NEOP|nr:unnamed protein product [Leptidea sinapis]